MKLIWNASIYIVFLCGLFFLGSGLANASTCEGVLTIPTKISSVQFALVKSISLADKNISEVRFAINGEGSAVLYKTATGQDSGHLPIVGRGVGSKYINFYLSSKNIFPRATVREQTAIGRTEEFSFYVSSSKEKKLIIYDNLGAQKIIKLPDQSGKLEFAVVDHDKLVGVDAKNGKIYIWRISYE